MTLYELARNQEIQSRLRDELLALDHELDVGDFMNASNLLYLDAVVKEGWVSKTLQFSRYQNPPNCALTLAFEFALPGSAWNELPFKMM